MKYIFFLFSIILWGCKENNPDPTDQLIGTYKIINYIIDGDTLISPSIGNLSNLPNPFINVLKSDRNVIKVEYNSNKSEKFEGALVLTFTIVPTQGKYIMVAPQNTIDIYSGYAKDDMLYLDWASWDYNKNKIVRIVTISKKE